MINIKLSNFEGPLDLLLHLIGIKKINIKDIVVSDVIDEYLQIIRTHEKDNFKFKVEFLQMASELLEIKALSILKSDKINDKTKDLEQRLLEYQMFKEFAKIFSENENEYYRSFTKKQGESFDMVNITHDYTMLNMENIENSLNDLFKRLAKENKYIMKIDVEEEFSVEEATKEILEIENLSKVKFSSLLNGKFSRSRIVSFFMAILDLYKNNYINIIIDENEFYIQKERNV